MEKLIHIFFLTGAILFFSCNEVSEKKVSLTDSLLDRDSSFYERLALARRSDSIAFPEVYNHNPNDPVFKRKLDSIWNADAKSEERNSSVETNDISRLTGLIIPDLSDSTLLKTMFGNVRLTDTIYCSGMPTMSEKMQYASFDNVDYSLRDQTVKNSFKINDSLVVIYFGAIAAYASPHFLYLDSGIICCTCNDGWKIVDCYKNRELNDFNEREFEGENGEALFFSYVTYETEYSAAMKFSEVIVGEKFQNKD